MTDPHGRFFAWLLDGAQGEPPRDLAVHAALCTTCMDWVAAYDALHRIDVGRAPLPPSHPTAIPRPAGLSQAGRVVAAAASLVLVGGAVILGASQILAGRSGNGQDRAGGVLAASGSPEPSPSAASELASASVSPTGSPSATPDETPQLTEPPATAYPVIPGTAHPFGTIGPSIGTAASSPPASAAATPTPTATPTVSPTPTPTPVETPTPTPTPLAS